MIINIFCVFLPPQEISPVSDLPSSEEVVLQADQRRERRSRVKEEGKGIPGKSEQHQPESVVHPGDLICRAWFMWASSGRRLGSSGQRGGRRGGPEQRG